MKAKSLTFTKHNNNTLRKYKTTYTRKSNTRKSNTRKSNTRKSNTHPNLIGYMDHPFKNYNIYLFQTLTPSIINGTLSVCEPDYPSEFLGDILTEEGNYFFLLVKHKVVVGFIIINNDYYDSQCSTFMENNSYIKLICLKKNKKSSKISVFFLILLKIIYVLKWESNI